MAYTHPQHGTAEEALALRKLAGAMLKEMRLAVEKTQRDVSNDCGFEYYTMISQIESGKVRVPPNVLALYARSLKVSPKFLAKELLKFYDPFTYEVLYTDKYER